MKYLTQSYPPNTIELHKYCKINLRKKRMLKKFYKNIRRYIPNTVYKEWLGLSFATPIVRRMFPRNLQISEIIAQDICNSTYSLKRD